MPSQMPFITLFNDADAGVCVEICRVMNHVLAKNYLRAASPFQETSNTWSQNQQLLMRDAL